MNAGNTNMNSKIFVIGFNKCGTSSLHDFFRKSGLRSVHFDDGRLALRMAHNMRSGRPLVAGYEDVDAFSDMQYLCQHVRADIIKKFPLIIEQVPDSLFILNVRDVDKWVASRLNWGNAHLNDTTPLEMGEGQDRFCPSPSDCFRKLGYAERYRRYHGFENVDQVVAHMMAEWQEHVASVKRRIPRDRLLVFDIERDDPVELCRFLGLPPEMAAHYGRGNPSLPPALRAIARAAPSPIRGIVPRNLRERLKLLLSRS